MFWHKKSKNSDQEYSASPKDSIDAMILEATRQGWLTNRNLAHIPELVSIYENASDYFMNVVDKSDQKMRETLVYHICKYLFAKAAEGVILWGTSPGGNISVYFHSKHLVGDCETEVPRHLHKAVIDTMSIGESLFRAHQEFVVQSQKQGLEFDLHEEIAKTIQWIPRFGINYALYHKFDALR
jgi:hypothetical protein